MTALDHCLAYLEKLPTAVEGSDGSGATYAAVLACRRFGLSDGDTWQAMTWFNENRCSPPWSEKELKHKAASVAEIQVKKPLGQSFGRRAVPKPVKADALRERMAARHKLAQARLLAEPPEAPPPIDDGPTAEYWGWPPLGAVHA